MKSLRPLGSSRIRGSRSRSRRRLSVEMLESRMCLSLAVPVLNSLPGANHSIYLDFDGHVTTGTAWNTGYGEDPITSPAWSLDADRANFSDDERATIERIWQRVSEDFIPFNVNVTTVEPPINDLRRGEVWGDTKWGVRVVTTIQTTKIDCQCGGIAHVGNFNDPKDDPVFVYNYYEKDVAEAISHEVGHSLGLAHDGLRGADGVSRTADDVEYYTGHGSGETSWAPIMGVGYIRNVTTWDRGEYFDTNNAGTTSNYNNGLDDLKVISTKNGFGYRLDDHGGKIATATALTAMGGTVSGNGIITTRADTDMFSFTTGGGNVALDINPAAIGANLDILAELFDSAGVLLASSNPVDTLHASLRLALTPGTYYLRIDGVGAGDPRSSTPTGYTDYDSIGRYSIAGTIIDPALPRLSVDDASMAEASGAAAAFVVRLNGAITEEVNVTYTTMEGTATEGSDYTENSGTLTFVPGGPTSQTVPVSVLDDAEVEPAETFKLILSNVSANAQLADGVGVASITNDDVLMAIGNASATEANVSRRKVISYTTATFSVALAQPVNRAVTVNFTTGAGGDTAKANVDYKSLAGSLSIPAGQTSGSIAITVIGDNARELNETFSVVINSADPIATNTGIGTIVDNDTKGKLASASAVAATAASSPVYLTVFGHIDPPAPSGLLVGEPTGAHNHASHEHGQPSGSAAHERPIANLGSSIEDLARLNRDDRSVPRPGVKLDALSVDRLAKQNFGATVSPSKAPQKLASRPQSSRLNDAGLRRALDNLSTREHF